MLETQEIRGTDIRTLAQQAEHPQGVRKSDLRQGDWVFVTTRNSVYAICVLGDGLYSVSGGWFDRQGESAATVAINGCTWGGSAIKQDVVAMCGLFLEFANRVTTTRIQHIRVVRNGELAHA